ncbi:hypothetical protein K2X96_03755 [Patescibacteria group bacterium]|nr:hypothetical protein [Patescibacteria group bacterium]
MNLDNIRAEVFKLRPHFGGVVREWGGRTWLEYYSQDFPGLSVPSEDVLSAIQYETSLILGESVGQKARSSISLNKWVNTADHHGLLCHPYFYSAALARSHRDVSKEAEATVTLPFGGISLGNDSFPRGFSFHDQKGDVVRMFFKSLKKRRMPVYGLAPMSIQELRLERDRVASLNLHADVSARLQSLLDAFLQAERIWTAETYSAQLSVMNSILWKQLFGDSRGEFVYLEIDTVVRRLLLTKHLVSDTPIFQLLFNKKWRMLFVELFSGVSGSHTLDTGTHFFWYIDQEQERRRGLFLKGDLLSTEEGDVAVTLTPESIAQGLSARTLMPSSALVLITLQGVEGLSCGGGSSQLEYLPVMMEQWNMILDTFSYKVTVPSAQIVCGHNALFSTTSVSGRQSCSSLFDILLYEKNSKNIIDTALKDVTVRDSINAMMPILYQLQTGIKIETPFPKTIHKILPL